MKPINRLYNCFILLLGGQPKLFGSVKVNKEEYSNRNWDIDASGPRVLHKPLNKPNYSLLANDIHGAKPQCVKF